MITTNNWTKLISVHERLVLDIPESLVITDLDTDIIAGALYRSRWLRINIRSLYKLYKMLPKLASGYYDDYTTGRIVEDKEYEITPSWRYDKAIVHVDDSGAYRNLYDKDGRKIGREYIDE